MYFIAIIFKTCRVSPGIAARAAHRTVLETLASHGSCYLICLIPKVQ